MTLDPEAQPYRSVMHWDPTHHGVWIGWGRKLAPACGQSEWIGVTDHREIVDCLKCIAALEKE
ncbi:hypothetical protein ABIB54_001986 [Frigoribacterium sp. UYMn621]